MRKIVIIVVLMLVPWSIATAQVLQIERDALIALYNSTNGAAWSDSTGWLGAVGTECGWYGVFCSGENVLWLYLGSNQLSGSIPRELGDLSGLQDLRLYSNQIGGSIPSQLGNLTSLTVLLLNANQLTGGIPPQLGNLSSVQNFSLNNNQLTGSIPPELETLQSATFLSLANNQLTGGIPSALGNLSNLQYLYLNSNPLGGSIPPELGNLSNLLGLRLYSNQLTGSIPPELGDLSSLTSLDLSSNRLSGSIPPELGDLSSLEYLHLNGTQLSGSIPPELVNLSALQNGNGLDLRFNALHSDDAGLIAFLVQKQIGGNWQDSQTVAPENLAVDWVGDHTVWLSWDAVSYQSNPGGYEAFVSPVAGGQWISAGRTAAKTELEIPTTVLDAGGSYDLAVASYTLPHVFNPNTVTSDLGESVMSTTANTGCATPVIDIAWGNPTTLSLTSGYGSYSWNTGETGPTIGVDPNDPRFYWVTVTSPGPCQESAIVLVDPLLFSDGFESGDLSRWSVAAL